MTKQLTATDFYLKELHALLGGTITNLARSGTDENSDDQEFYGLVITMPDGREQTLFLLSDDEGNGPGSFRIV